MSIQDIDDALKRSIKENECDGLRSAVRHGVITPAQALAWVESRKVESFYIVPWLEKRIQAV